MATGSLLQNEQLFAAKGGSLAAAVSIRYDSLDPRVGTLGAKWSHNYDVALVLNEDGSATLREGSTRSFYNLANGAFVPETGDYSTLVKTADNSYTITFKDGAKKMFSASGQLTTEIDLSGNALTFMYGESGKLVSVTDAAARAVTFGYDVSGRLTTITDPAGRDYAFTYSGNFLVAVTWPDGGSWHYTYDAKGFMLSKTDPLGNLTTYTYDANKRVIQGSDSSGTIIVAHSNATTITKGSIFTEEDGGIWNYTHDSHNGVLTEKTDPLGKTTSYAYDANRNLIKETAPDGSVTSYSYDTAGNRLSMTDALGKTTTYSYNSLGQVTSTIDALGHTTTNTYDDKGRLTQTIDPLGAKTTYVYNGRGNLTSVTNALNQTSTFSYDAAGNQTSSTDPSGATTTFTYDAMGNTLTQKDALGKVTSFEYDGRYRLAKSTDPLGNSTSYDYDLKGNKTSQADANGNVTRYEYDLQGHLVKSVDALDNATTYTYGGTGCASCGGGADKITSVTDAKGQVTSYQYDLLGRLVKETDPLGKATLYAYDAVGNLITKTDANGAATTFAYDVVKRLKNKTYSDTSSESYSYDAVGRVVAASNANVTYSTAYDAAGRVTSVTDSRGYVIAYSYDLAGNRSKMTLQPGTADERTTFYSYNVAGHVSGITSNVGTFAYGYDTLGRRVSLAYPNGITANYSYDSAGRLTSLSHGSVASFAYTLDKVGNRTGKTATETEKYLYDSTYRLLGVVSTKPEIFSYDAVGNRLTGPSAKDIGYLYSAGNQMLQGRKHQYGYDNNGNQTTRAIPGATDKSWSLTWDYENRLVKVEKVSGAETKSVKFSYDPLGRRIGKQVTTVIDGVTKTEVHAYIYDNDNIILEAIIDGSGTIKTFFTHGSGVDEHLAMESNQRFSYYNADGLGSVVALTDQNKRVVQSYEYGSFGMLKPSSKSANSYTYTGREWDKETGLYYYRARYYDPMEGRFVSKDPIGFKVGINLYIYVESNPLNFTDPFGLDKSDFSSLCKKIFPSLPPKKPGEGCGDAKSDKYIPDLYLKACQEHDKCYDTPGVSRAQCDNNFFWNMVAESGPQPNIVGPTIYWLGVRLGGADAFNAAQKGGE